MTIKRLAVRTSVVSITVLWLSWALNNDLVERGWLTRGEPIVVAGFGIIVALAAWIVLARPWEREERMPLSLPPAEAVADRQRTADPLVPASVGSGTNAHAHAGRTGITVGDIALLLASALLLVAAVAALPSVMEGLRGVW